MLQRAALDGHTALRRSMLVNAVGGDEDDEVVHVGDYAALRRYADAERAIADAVDSITLAVGGPTSDSDLEALAAAVATGERVTIAGDPALLPSPVAGNVFRDLFDSQRAKVEEVGRAATSPITRLADAVAQGGLPTVEAPDREVVVVPAADAVTAARRVEQLVHDSIPRTFGIAGDDIAVLSPVRRGPAGVDALSAVASNVRTVHASLGQQWRAVVVVFPPDVGAALTRPLVYTAITRATQHLSIVHACGPALARAVRQSLGRRRSTLLPHLLAS